LKIHWLENPVDFEIPAFRSVTQIPLENPLFQFYLKLKQWISLDAGFHCQWTPGLGMPQCGAGAH
jgi:hypothetical protein